MSFVYDKRGRTNSRTRVLTNGDLTPHDMLTQRYERRREEYLVTLIPKNYVSRGAHETHEIPRPRVYVHIISIPWRKLYFIGSSRWRCVRGPLRNTANLFARHRRDTFEFYDCKMMYGKVGSNTKWFIVYLIIRNLLITLFGKWVEVVAIKSSRMIELSILIRLF